jgi:hypothetical protein
MLKNLARWILLILAGLCALLTTWFGVFAHAWGGSGSGKHTLFVLFWLPPALALPAFLLKVVWPKLPVLVFWIAMVVQFAHGWWLNWLDCRHGNCILTSPTAIALSGFAFPQVWGWILLATCLQLKEAMPPNN